MFVYSTIFSWPTIVAHIGHDDIYKLVNTYCMCFCTVHHLMQCTNNSWATKWKLQKNATTLGGDYVRVRSDDDDDGDNDVEAEQTLHFFQLFFQFWRILEALQLKWIIKTCIRLVLNWWFFICLFFVFVWAGYMRFCHNNIADNRKKREQERYQAINTILWLCIRSNMCTWHIHTKYACLHSIYEQSLYLCLIYYIAKVFCSKFI